MSLKSSVFVSKANLFAPRMAWRSLLAILILEGVIMSMALKMGPRPQLTMRSAHGSSQLRMVESDENISEEFIKGLSSAAETTKKGLTRFGSSLAEGGNFKQAVADALAGDFDREVTQKKIQETAKSGKVMWKLMM